MQNVDLKYMLEQSTRRQDLADRIVGWVAFFGIVLLLATDLIDQVTVFVG